MQLGSRFKFVRLSAVNGWVVAMIENDSDWEESDEEEYSDEEDFSHRMCALDRALNWR